MPTMRTEERQHDDPRRTYWPRFGPAVPPPDFADDRHCAHCGYNLRGLAYSDACPECGSVRGMSPSDEPLPFDDKPTLWNYFATLGQILVDPEEFGSQVWREEHLDWRAARKFRRISMTIAFCCAGAVVFVLAREAAGDTVALAAWPFCMIAVIVGMRQMTLGRLRFLENHRLLPRDPQRAKALISYLTASLALSPLHLPALYASRPAMEQGLFIGAAAVHAVVLLVQFLLASQAEAHFLWQLVEMPKGQARLMGVLGAVTRLLAALWYCVALPAMFVFIGKTLEQG
jgi:hypothetical protein